MLCFSCVYVFLTKMTLYLREIDCISLHSVSFHIIPFHFSSFRFISLHFVSCNHVSIYSSLVACCRKFIFLEKNLMIWWNVPRFHFMIKHSIPKTLNLKIRNKYYNHHYHRRQIKAPTRSLFIYSARILFTTKPSWNKVYGLTYF